MDFVCVPQSRASGGGSDLDDSWGSVDGLLDTSPAKKPKDTNTGSGGDAAASPEVDMGGYQPSIMAGTRRRGRGLGRRGGATGSSSLGGTASSLGGGSVIDSLFSKPGAGAKKKVKDPWAHLDDSGSSDDVTTTATSARRAPVCGAATRRNTPAAAKSAAGAGKSDVTAAAEQALARSQAAMDTSADFSGEMDDEALAAAMGGGGGKTLGSTLLGGTLNTDILSPVPASSRSRSGNKGGRRGSALMMDDSDSEDDKLGCVAPLGCTFAWSCLTDICVVSAVVGCVCACAWATGTALTTSKKRVSSTWHR